MVSAVVFLALCPCASVVNIHAQTTEFTYQGKLTDGGTPTSVYDFEFRLFDAATLGTQLGTTQQRLGEAVSGGLPPRSGKPTSFSI